MVVCAYVCVCVCVCVSYLLRGACYDIFIDTIFISMSY